jgi:hypothetical protein
MCATDAEMLDFNWAAIAPGYAGEARRFSAQAR